MALFAPSFQSAQAAFGAMTLGEAAGDSVTLDAQLGLLGRIGFPVCTEYLNRGVWESMTERLNARMKGSNQEHCHVNRKFAGQMTIAAQRFTLRLSLDAMLA